MKGSKLTAWEGENVEKEPREDLSEWPEEHYGDKSDDDEDEEDSDESESEDDENEDEEESEGEEDGQDKDEGGTEEGREAKRVKLTE